MLTVQTDEDGIAGSDFTMSAGDKLSKLQFLKLLHFTEDYGAGKLDEVKKEIIWHSISEFDPSTRLRYLSESGFQRNITWLLGCRMNIRSIDDEHKLIVICRAITEFEIRSVGVLGLIFDIITIAQCILTFIRISDVRNHYEIGMALTAIDCVWTLDIGIRLVGTQWGRYCRSRHLLNGIITIIVFAVNLSTPPVHLMMRNVAPIARVARSHNAVQRCAHCRDMQIWCIFMRIETVLKCAAYANLFPLCSTSSV